jgi:hypothetical protein
MIPAKVNALWKSAPLQKIEAGCGAASAPHCEEAFYQISERGIEAFTGHVRSKAERPLHEN